MVNVKFPGKILQNGKHPKQYFRKWEEASGEVWNNWKRIEGGVAIEFFVPIGFHGKEKRKQKNNREKKLENAQAGLGQATTKINCEKESAHEVQR